MNIRVFALFLCLLLPAPAEAKASDIVSLRQQRLAPYLDYPCAKLGIPKALAMAIARQESGWNHLALNIAGKTYSPKTAEQALKMAQNALTRGVSFDVGLMQINSFWIRKYNLPLPALFDPAGSAYVGCWILRQEIDRHGMTWEAVGRYHSPTPSRTKAYAARIRKHLMEILFD